MDWLLGPEQFEFVTDLTSPAIALRGGVGSGKSYAAVRAILMRSKANPPEVQCAIVEPTYPMVRDIIVPLFRDCLDAAGVWYRLNKSTMELEWDNPSNPRVILLR